MTDSGRGPALVHDAFALEIRILGVLDDGDAQGAGQLERAPHDLGVPDRLPVVGHGDRAGLDQILDLGQLLAHLPARDRGDGMDPRVTRFPGAPDHPLDARPIVEGRRGVRHAGHRGEPAARRGTGPGLDGLLLLLARLAQMNVDVHEPRADDRPRDLYHLRRAVPAHVGGRVLAPSGNTAVRDPEILDAVDAARGVEDPTAADAERVRHGFSWSPAAALRAWIRPAPCVRRGDRARPCAPRLRS